MSLRARILLLATGTAALVVVLAGVPIALLLRSAAYDDLEQDARAAAQSTADYLSTGRYDDTVLSQYLDRLNARGHCSVTVVMGDGDVLGAALPDGVAPRERDHSGLGHNHDRDDLGRVSSATVTDVDEGRVVELDAQSTQGVAQVFALAPDRAVRDEVVERCLIVAGCAVALLLLAAGAAEITARRLARPLERTAETAVRLSGGDLLARAPVEGPAEVSRVAVELNALADRIDELLARERETTADLSHRLRTPLTAVRLGVESLPAGTAKDELEAHVAALERTLTQIIHAARRPQREGVHPRCDAVEVMRERVAFWSPLAEDQGRKVTVTLPDGEVPVRAAAEDLGAALDALIENVLAHTPEGTAFEVAVRVEGSSVVEVLDEGPGIPPAALDRGRSHHDSTGLGLDIARSFAEGAGGSLSLVDGGVRLTLPAVDPADGKT
ncbi:HAMP domain-containing sensor histidine kinase [Nocardioides sp. KR10-350]|uniref:HAMP domain-containing sensor histidine kinase n=1 Tax=Nocardioides cheoyonin TaxID=3156615 RepID=UPI0032B45616